ncbi:hypothetical protein MTR67_036342 [Solanum verrucosum]|uniref:Uncharacterized protein n=1 Tax=Solanum verrucosum TaxID=315347 RepID=A0AAF0UBL3_SOLVR|nr:hypothetical protein MTR67_036342 [Solanum verrucosum]
MLNWTLDADPDYLRLHHNRMQAK